MQISNEKSVQINQWTDYKGGNLVDIQSVSMKLSDIELEKSSKKNFSLLIDGEEIHVTDRFLHSIFSYVGLGANTFNYFSPEEVFNRVISAYPSKEKIRITIDRNTRSAYAIGSLDKSVPTNGDISRILEECPPLKYKLSPGVLSLFYKCGDENMKIIGDDYEKNYFVDIPIDGYGDPSVNVSLMRVLCSNGLYLASSIFSKKFKSGTKKEGFMNYLVINNIRSFNDFEAYDAVSERLEISAGSKASIKEYGSLHKLLFNEDITFSNIGENNEKRDKNLSYYKAFVDMASNPLRTYGLINFDSLSAKRASMTPVDCTVYDLVQFATEYSTHCDPTASEKVSRWVVDKITNEYDLERSIMKSGEASIEMTKIGNNRFFVN